MNAQTVASQNPESLLEYALAFWGSLEMQILLALFITGLLGQMASYTYKWLQDEIKGDLWQYLFKDNFKKTSLTFVGYMSSAVLAVMADIFMNDQQFAGWTNVLTWGWLNGLALDLAFNKGQTAVWSESKRKAVREQEAAAAKKAKSKTKVKGE